MQSKLTPVSTMVGGFWTALLLSNAAHAASDTKLNLCNEHEQNLYVSVAYEPEAGSPFMARGWWSIPTKECSEISFPLGSDKILLHAVSENGALQWVGDQKLCVNVYDKFDFEDAGAQNCAEEGLETRGFKELSVSALASLEPGETPKYKFLPSDAVKSGSLVKICNDSSEDAYVSFSQKSSATTSTLVDGWFKIQPSKCYETLRRPSANELLLFAQSSSGHMRWKGDVALCTDDYDGFQFTDAQSMTCDGDNQRWQRFRKIDMTSSSTDFEYRLRAEDAQPVRSIVKICNTRSEKLYVATAWDNLDFPGQVVSIGWLNLEPNKCSDDLAVNGNSLLLYVDKDDGEAVISGTTQVCVNIEDGFEFGNSTAMNCSGEDLTKLGFASQPISAGAVRIDIP
jgi:uncharacterized membrane protein